MKLPEDGDSIAVEAVQLAMRKNEIKKKHVRMIGNSLRPIPVSFCPSDGKKGRWQTQVLEDGKYKTVKFTHEADLWMYLENYYSQKHNHTLSEVYHDWSEGRKIECPGTASKDSWVWRKFYEEEKIADMPIAEISVEDIKSFLRDACVKHSLTERKLKEVKSLLNLVFDYAYEKEYVNDRKPRRITKIGNWACVRPDQEKPDELERFAVEEAAAVCKAAIELYHKTDDSLYLAIPLSFQIGVRAGEMVVLQFGDFSGDVLTLQRQEVKGYEITPDGIRKSGFRIVPWLKKKKRSRSLPVTASAKEVLTLLKHYNSSHGLGAGEDDFLFQRLNGEPHHTNDLHKRQMKACRAARVNGEPIAHRSFHKIRKTWISSLLTFKSIPITNIRDMAGHSDAKTTLNVYGKTILPDSKVRADMEQALPPIRLSV